MSTGEWRKWLLQQLIGEGVHNVMLEEQIQQEAGRHYDTNLDLALRSLRDEGIIVHWNLVMKKNILLILINYMKLNK